MDGTVIFGGAIYGGTFNGGAVFSLDVRPRLSIATAEDGVKFSWPGYTQDYQLEQSPALTARWSNSIDAVSVVSLTQVLQQSIGSTNLFYRLRRT